MNLPRNTSIMCRCIGVVFLLEFLSRCPFLSALLERLSDSVYANCGWLALLVWLAWVAHVVTVLGAKKKKVDAEVSKRV